MPPAARVGDPTAHGTPLSGNGSSNVLIDGMPAWRAGSDVHSCPISTGPAPHVGGVVTMGSTTVLINGMPAARMGDVIAENGPPNAIAGGSPTVIIDGGSSSTPPQWAQSLYDRLSSHRVRYNENVGEADLGPAGDVLKNERINLYVTAEGSEAAFSFRMDRSNRINEFEPGPRDDATARMETDRKTIDRITDADDPVQAFRSAILEDNIRIQGVGMANELKWAVVNQVVDIGISFGIL